MKINNVFLARFLFILYSCAYNPNVTIMAEEGGVELPKIEQAPPAAPEGKQELHERHRRLQERLQDIDKEIAKTHNKIRDFNVAKGQIEQPAQTEQDPQTQFYEAISSSLEHLSSLHEKLGRLQQQRKQLSNQVEEIKSNLQKKMIEPAQKPQKPETTLTQQFQDIIPADKGNININSINRFAQEVGKNIAEWNLKIKALDPKQLSQELDPKKQLQKLDPKKQLQDELKNRLQDLNNLYTHIEQLNVEDYYADKPDLQDKLSNTLTALRTKIIDHRNALEKVLIEDIHKNQVTMWQKVTKAIKNLFKRDIKASTSSFIQKIQEAKIELDKFLNRSKVFAKQEKAVKTLYPTEHPTEGEPNPLPAIKQINKIIEQQETPQEKIETLQRFETYINQNVSKLKNLKPSLEKDSQQILELKTQLDQQLKLYKDNYKTLFEKIINDPALKGKQIPEEMQEIITENYGNQVYEAFKKDFEKLKDMGIEPTGSLGPTAQEYLNYKGDTAKLALNKKEYAALKSIDNNFLVKLIHKEKGKFIADKELYDLVNNTIEQQNNLLKQIKEKTQELKGEQ